MYMNPIQFPCCQNGTKTIPKTKEEEGRFSSPCVTSPGEGQSHTFEAAETLARIHQWQSSLAQSQTLYKRHFLHPRQRAIMGDEPWIQSISDYEETTYFNAPYLQNTGHTSGLVNNISYQGNVVDHQHVAQTVTEPYSCPQPGMMNNHIEQQPNIPDSTFSDPSKMWPNPRIHQQIAFQNEMPTHPLQNMDVAGPQIHGLHGLSSQDDSMSGTVEYLSGLPYNFNGTHSQESSIQESWNGQTQVQDVSPSVINYSQSYIASHDETSPSSTLPFPEQTTEVNFDHLRPPFASNEEHEETRWFPLHPVNLNQHQYYHNEEDMDGQFHRPRKHLPDRRAKRGQQPSLASPTEAMPGNPGDMDHSFENSESPKPTRGYREAGSHARNTSRQRGVRNPPSPQSMEERAAKDEFLISARKSGMSYKEIKMKGGFTEAESTLRGRHRMLTKSKDQRVRNPIWTEIDKMLLMEAAPKFDNGKIGRARKISWKEVSQYILENGGTYEFGTSTCKKKWETIMGIEAEQEEDEDNSD